MEIFNEDYVAFNNIDLTNISEITIACKMRRTREIGG